MTKNMTSIINKINIFLYRRSVSIDKKLEKIRIETSRIIKGQTQGQKILFGMSFSIYEPCRVHDFLLSQALFLRSAVIIPVICGALQEGECNVFGGIWGGYTGNIKHNMIKSKDNCKQCIETDNLLWKDWVGIEPISLSSYINSSDKESIKSLTDSFNISGYKQWSYEEMPVGQWALDVLRNNALVGDETLVEDFQVKLKAYLFNILLITESCKRVLDEIKPDIIIANDSYYYMWAIIEKLAAKRAIPFYSHWSGGRRGGWCYAKGESAMALNLSEPWKTWKDRDLTDVENQVIDEFLKTRHTGKTMMLNTADPRKNARILDKDDLKSVNFNKPTALLAANVIWDLAALDKEIQFKNMIDWICRVIDFFEINTEFQLIIKAHPGEKNQTIPQTRQLIWDEIKKYRDILPDNVIFMSPTSSISVYDLIPHVKIGMVFTSTVGLEMSCYGIPVITAGKSPYYTKGFTYDTSNSKEYFQILSNLLKYGEKNIERKIRIKLARKFFYLYYFRYYTSLNLFDYSLTDKPVLNISGGEDLMPGKNKVLDYICDSMLNHLPIVSKDRWPPD